MSKFLFGLLGVCALAVAYVFLGGNPELLGQQVQTVDEVYHLKQHPVILDRDLGVATARIGEGRLKQVDATLVEIPPGGHLPAHRHLAEEMIYIISGKGYTLMWNSVNGKKERYDWAEGDLLSPSLNAWHQHFNASSDTPARYLTVTTAPLTKNIFKNDSFLSSTDFSFGERWEKSVGQKPEYVGNATKGAASVRMRVGHLLPNLPNRKMKDRGIGMSGITILPEGDMAGNQLLEMEVREFTSPNAVGHYHRHLWEVVYVVLKGEGYTVLQREGEPERRIDWGAGDLFIVEANEYHDNRPRGGAGGSRLQIKASGYFRRVGIDQFLMQNKPGWN